MPIKLSKRRKPRKSVMDVYEPTAMEHSLLTQQDNQIKLADIPERYRTIRDVTFSLFSQLSYYNQCA